MADNSMTGAFQLNNAAIATAQFLLWLELTRPGADAADVLSDPELRDALLKLARNEDSRKCLVLLGRIVSAPDLTERLMDVLRPREEGAPALSSPPEMGWLQ